MITLCMDTSHIYLVLGLIKDGKLIDSYCEPCHKQQSEKIFPELIQLLEKNHISQDEIGEVVITKGPGSYTGVRIAMSIAKVLCATKNLPLYTIGTLRLYAGDENGRVLLDARGNRAYTAVYQDGAEVEAANVKYLEDIQDDLKIIGDGELIGKETYYPNLAENFLKVKKDWHLEENVHTVVPEYLKEREAYFVKK